MDKYKAHPLVSIVLPMFNAEQYIKECVDSILAQTYTNFELIIIDDGSTDNSVRIVGSYHDTRIRLVRNMHDYIGSLNKGLSESRGKYIARMDADDKMKPQRLERQVKVMEAHPEIALCCGYMQRLGGTEIYNSGIEGIFKGFKQLLLVGNFIAHPTVMLRKVYLEEYNLCYSNKYPYAEDYKLWTEIAIKGGKLYVVPEAFIDYRISGGQVSRKYNVEQANSALKIRNELLAFMIDHDSNPYRKEFENLYDSLVALNEKSMIEDGIIFSLFYQLFSALDSKR